MGGGGGESRWPVRDEREIRVRVRVERERDESESRERERESAYLRELVLVFNFCV